MRRPNPIASPRAAALVALVLMLTAPVAGQTARPSGGNSAAAPDGALFQVILEVGDMDRQVAFYRDTLGLRLTEGLGPMADPGFARFETAGADLALHARTGPDRRTATARISFMTTDVAGRRKQLLTRGAELGPIRSPAPGILVADGRDPEGNVFHIESRLDRPTDPEAAEASVRRALQGWVRAFNEGDWERYLEFYADDGRFHLHEVGRTLYTSRAAVEEAFRSTYSAVAQASLVAEQVALAVVSDRVAVIAAEYRQTLAFADGTRLDLAGSMHLLLERSAAGWRIVAGDGIARQ